MKTAQSGLVPFYPDPDASQQIRQSVSKPGRSDSTGRQAMATTSGLSSGWCGI